MKYRFVIFAVFLSSTLWGQDNLAGRKLLAKDLIVHSKYGEALATLRQSQELRYRDTEGQFLQAVCHYQLNNLDEAEGLLKAILEKEKAPFPETWLYLGKVYHARHQFAEAAQFYKRYLKGIDSDHPHRQMVLEELKRCSNGLQLQYRAGIAFVENLGPGVNTAQDEFGPVLSPNHGDRLYFSSRRPGNIGGARNREGRYDERLGEYFSDIYSARNQRGAWGSVQPMHYLLNSPRHDVLLDFNSDGQVMYFYQGNDWYNGTIIVDTFRQVQDRVVSSDPFSGPVEATIDQAAPHFFKDGFVLFSSNRPGGFGGMDLYITSLSNGRWSAPVNLGPDINTSFDETTPFLARDGRTLYFSSNDSRRSIGGYDVFRSVYLPKGNRWLPPENLGLPVNSSADDTHFRLAGDGFTAFFTSSRKDGYGMRDLYIAYFDQYREEQEPPQVLEETFFYEFAGITRPAASPSPRFAPRRPEGSFVRPVRSDPGENLLNASHREMLDQVGTLLKQHPDWRLTLRVRMPEVSSAVSEKLFAGLRDARPLLDYLTGSGVVPERLTLLGEMQPASSLSSPLEIDFHLAGTGAEAVTGEWKYLDETPLPALQYRVQIATLSGPFEGTFMDGLSAPAVEQNGRRRQFYYLSGAFTTFASAEKWRKKLFDRGVVGATVVPYIAGSRVDDDRVENNSSRFPDLQHYLLEQEKSSKKKGSSEK